MLNTSCAFKVVAGFWGVPAPLDKMAIALLINLVSCHFLMYVRTSTSTDVATDNSTQKWLATTS